MRLSFLEVDLFPWINRFYAGSINKQFLRFHSGVVSSHSAYWCSSPSLCKPPLTYFLGGHVLPSSTPHRRFAPLPFIAPSFVFLRFCQPCSIRLPLDLFLNWFCLYTEILILWQCALISGRFSISLHLYLMVHASLISIAVLSFVFLFPSSSVAGPDYVGPSSFCLCPRSIMSFTLGAASRWWGAPGGGRASGRKTNRLVHLKWFDLPLVWKCVTCVNLTILFFSFLPLLSFFQNVYLTLGWIL